MDMPLCAARRTYRAEHVTDGVPLKLGSRRWRTLFCGRFYFGCKRRVLEGVGRRAQRRDEPEPGFPVQTALWSSLSVKRRQDEPGHGVPIIK